SPNGHQPMTSASGRYVMVFNGEVYNHAELRRELEPLGFHFRGHSDTEVMLAAFEAWGVEPAVKRFVGMFAIALWDRQARALKLIRDRLGIKPLYYGWVQGAFLFGSELKALRAWPKFAADIDRDSLCLYLRHNYLPAPYSIYRNICKLLPGRILSVPLHARGPDEVRSDIYWSLRAVAEAGGREPFASDAEATAALEATLKQAVAYRMIADVPLGAFLSGGVDSSTVVALMQAQSRRPVQTFSIGFREHGYDEAAHARRVAAQLGTAHTELYVTPKEARDVIPLLPAMFDEPFADSSQIPTYLVAKLARTAVTVSLSGDGGDELFAGYDRYFHTQAIWRKISWMSRGARSWLGAALQAAPLPLLDFAGAALGFLPGPKLSADRLRKLGALLGSASQQDLYREMLGHWRDPVSLVKGARLPDYFLSDSANWTISKEPVEDMCFADLNSYLPDDILAKVDRASMAVSLEARVPLLDHRVVELAWRVPMHMKIRNGQSKWLLRQVLYKYVPPELIERPKMGFGLPIDTWLLGPLRDWVEALLSEERLQREGFFNAAPIRAKWREHLSGKRRWHFPLWDVLMFQAWLEAAR
ncbi:MAG: asparagine synthase (glutamine-hydrolyzing), partial [Gammaproteobacteria bacterium]|nr:asparagine synthase (glutamine-hydrolyzing) [Gammaproteobacteria bacterium]